MAMTHAIEVCEPCMYMLILLTCILCSLMVRQKVAQEYFKEIHNKRLMRARK